MTSKSFIATVLAAGLAALGATAQDHGHATGDAPYAGLDSRRITSLSEADIEELRRGGGWGLALPAELNGQPGPAHLLELREPLGLSEAQVAAIEAIYRQMRAEAIAAGERYIAAEAALDAAFEAGGLDEAELGALIGAAEAARAELRRIHLSRHLETPPLLTEGQIRAYNVLRGYAEDPCGSAPEGHDPERWRQHNDCG